MLFVSVTRLRLRSWRYLPGFILQSLRAAWQAKSTRGNLSTCIMGEADLAFWTRTIWGDEPSMRSFMLSGAPSAGDAAAIGLVRRGSRRPLEPGSARASLVERVPPAPSR